MPTRTTRMSVDDVMTAVRAVRAHLGPDARRSKPYGSSWRRSPSLWSTTDPDRDTWVCFCDDGIPMSMGGSR